MRSGLFAVAALCLIAVASGSFAVQNKLEVVSHHVHDLTKKVNTANDNCNSFKLKPSTRYDGTPLESLMLQFPPNFAATFICSLADGKPVQAVKMGPSKRYKNEFDYEITVFQPGSGKFVEGNATTMAGLPPPPPTPPPPPPCSTFADKGFAACPKYCFWVEDKCADEPPINCGDIFSRKPHQPFCINIVLFNSDPLKPGPTGNLNTFNWSAGTVSEKTKIDTTPTQHLKPGQSMWWSVDDGLYINATTKKMEFVPWEACVQYTQLGGGSNANTGFHLCTTLAGGEIDMQPGFTSELAGTARYQEGRSSFYAQLLVWANTTSV